MKKYTTLEESVSLQKLNEGTDEVLKIGATLIKKLSICAKILPTRANLFNEVANQVKNQMSKGDFDDSLFSTLGVKQQAQTPQQGGGAQSNPEANNEPIKFTIWFISAFEYLAKNWEHILAYLPNEGDGGQNNKSIYQIITDQYPNDKERVKKELVTLQQFLIKLLGTINKDTRPTALKIDDLVKDFLSTPVQTMTSGMKELSNSPRIGEILKSAKEEGKSVESSADTSLSGELKNKDEVAKVRNWMVKVRDSMKDYKGDKLSAVLDKMIQSGIIDLTKLQ